MILFLNTISQKLKQYLQCFLKAGVDVVIFNGGFLLALVWEEVSLDVSVEKNQSLVDFKTE